jgi:hypothetical protein
VRDGWQANDVAGGRLSVSCVLLAALTTTGVPSMRTEFPAAAPAKPRPVTTTDCPGVTVLGVTELMIGADGPVSGCTSTTTWSANPSARTVTTLRPTASGVTTPAGLTAAKRDAADSHSKVAPMMPIPA